MWMISCTCMRVESYSCTSVFVHITRHKYIYLSVFFMFSFSSASVYFHLFHPHNHHLSPNSPRLMFLYVKCATVNKVYLILSYLILYSYIYIYIHICTYINIYLWGSWLGEHFVISVSVIIKLNPIVNLVVIKEHVLNDYMKQLGWTLDNMKFHTWGRYKLASRCCFKWNN